MVHKCLPPTWTMDLEMQTYMVESIVSLLKEAKLHSHEQREMITATNTSGITTSITPAASTTIASNTITNTTSVAAAVTAVATITITTTIATNTTTTTTTISTTTTTISTTNTTAATTTTGPPGASSLLISTNNNNKSNAVAIPPIDNLTAEDRQLLGRYGVWLLVGRCTPNENTPVHIMGRLIAMLFHWFHMTAYSHDGQEESTLEKLKVEHICGWLRDICKTHYKLFISCLLPHPPEYARVGGHWDSLASRTSHLKDGLNRLFCLIPYDVITQDIWDYIMPHWMEAIVNDVPEKELIELKITLSKILDIEMSPLGFDAEKMYHFVAERFQKTNTSRVQEQALHWLQTLTLLEVNIPLQLLFTIFGDGIKNIKNEDDVEEKLNKMDNSVKQGLICKFSVIEGVEHILSTNILQHR